MIGIAGVIVFLFVAFLFSKNRKRIPWKTVLFSMILQFLFAFFMLKTAIGVKIFSIVNKLFVKLISYSNYGSRFLFGKLVDSTDIGAIVAFQVLPIIIFISALMGVLSYFGIIQLIVKGFAKVFYRTLKITGVEAFVSSLLIFMGIEAITGIKKYIERMSESEIFTIMTTFMATIAGSVMATYVSFGAKAGHLFTASIMSAPSAIAISKIMVPETEEYRDDPISKIEFGRGEKNFISAMAQGASDGLNLSLQIAGMLIAFVSMIYLLNDLFGLTGITLEKLLSYIFYPFALLSGVPSGEALEAGRLLGIKVLFNEFISYLELSKHISNHTLSQRTIDILSYSLCGFANFGSMAILIGGISAIAPKKREVVSKLGFYSIAGGMLATLITSAIASLFIK